jgi:arsenate reductase-like glutaredoxin family protein
VYSLLKQASAITSEYTTKDQASDYLHQTLARREEFKLNITKDPPTAEQLKSILEYIGTQRASTIVRGAKNKTDTIKKLKENRENFQKPVIRYTTSQSFSSSIELGC